MNDLEPLLAKNFNVENRLGNGMMMSFCSWAKDLDAIDEECIKSIDNIGKELGFTYEIIVSGGKSYSSHSEDEHMMMRKYPDLSEVIVDEQTRGLGKNVAFENSAGKFIIMFDTGTVYGIEMADMIHNFILSGIKKMVFSPLVIIPRTIMNEVGRWRELREGDEIDLYSRVAISYGILAFPFSGSRKGKGSFSLPSPEISMDQATGILSKILSVRDYITGCNYALSDIKSFLGTGNKRSIIKDWSLYGLAFLLSRISKIKPFRYDRNNYLIVLESILESLVLREYTRIDVADIPIRFKMSEVQISYLEKKSKLYTRIKDSMVLYNSPPATEEAL